MKNDGHHYDVIVAGCGPVGAVAANLLGHHGLRTLVIEKDREPYTLPRAIHFDHEIMRIFQSAGMAEALLPHLSTPAGAMYFGASRTPIRQFQANLLTGRLGWAADYYFYQPDLEQAMRSALAERPSVELLWGHEVEVVEQDSDRVRVSARGDNGDTFTVTAEYLLSCDGGRSTVRKQLGIELDDLGFDEPWIVVDANVDGPVTIPEFEGTPPGVDMQDVLFIIADPARPTSVIPGVGRHRRWEFLLLPGETAEDYVDLARARALVSPWVGDQPFELIRCAVYRFHALLAERWQQDRVFLIGDSAHQTPPFFGQGLCHGIRDAANLAWKLNLVLGGAASPALLATYEPERAPQVRAIIDASVRVGQNLCILDVERAKRRDAELGAIAAATPVGYVDIIPPLSAGLLAAREEGSPVGARFIQPWMLGQGGRRALLDDLTGGGFVVLARNGVLAPGSGALAGRLKAPLACFSIFEAGAEVSAEGVLVDETGELLKWLDYYSCGGVILRPDFYVYGVFSTDAQAVELVQGLAAQLDARG